MPGLQGPVFALLAPPPTAGVKRPYAPPHLIVFGDPQSNQVMARALPNLPLRWDARELSLGGKTYDSAKHTVAMVYPNPLNPRRYIVMNSGHPFHRAARAATTPPPFPHFPDFSLLASRRRSPAFVVLFHRSCSARGLVRGGPAGCAAVAFTRRPVAMVRFRRL